MLVDFMLYIALAGGIVLALIRAITDNGGIEHRVWSFLIGFIVGFCTLMFLQLVMLVIYQSFKIVILGHP